MKYLEGEELTKGEIKAALRKATISNEIVPVVCGSSYKNRGVQKLLDAIVDYMPAPTDVAAIKAPTRRLARKKIALLPMISRSLHWHSRL